MFVFCFVLKAFWAGRANGSVVGVVGVRVVGRKVIAEAACAVLLLPGRV